MADRIDLYHVLRERVDRGVALLDQRVPDWRDRIDTTAFTVEDSCRCVLGQLGNAPGGFISMLHLLDLDGEQVALHGFDFFEVDDDPVWLVDRFEDEAECGDDVTGEGFGMLDDLWLQRI